MLDKLPIRIRENILCAKAYLIPPTYLTARIRGIPMLIAKITDISQFSLSIALF